MKGKLERVLEMIDEVNRTDPNKEWAGGEELPKEWIYGRRMTEMLSLYTNSASEELQIAARGQHIKRWQIPRSDYPMDRKGYLKWRTMLKIFHGEKLAEIMSTCGYEEASVAKVVELVSKKKLKTDPESKLLEDIICLVFLKFYFHDFARKHEDEKVIDIVQKTWGKMTEKGHEMALKLEYEPSDLKLLQSALE